jgi:hypothetical protein
VVVLRGNMCLKGGMKVDKSRQVRLSSEEDNSKANPSSRQKRRSDLYIDSRRETRVRSPRARVGEPQSPTQLIVYHNDHSNSKLFDWVRNSR